MKQPDLTHLEETIRRDVSALGLDLGERAITSMALHLGMVLRTTGSLNLIAPSSPAEAVRRHVTDSLTSLAEVQRARPGPMADLGSGAGFPGVPLALASGRRTTLIESVGKKAGFLRDVIDATGAPCEVAAMRSEELALERPGGFEVIVVRAVAELPVLVELAAPLLREGGRLVAMKGSPGTDEVGRGERAAHASGMGPARFTTVIVPGLAESRVLVVFEREGEASVALPRRAGMAKKRPLA